jgi:hypothetical protein
MVFEPLRDSGMPDVVGICAVFGERFPYKIDKKPPAPLQRL